MNKKKKSTNTSPYPDEVIDRLARAFYPAILACWNSEEGQREFAAWQAEQVHLAKNEKQEVPSGGELPAVHIVLVCGFWQGASAGRTLFLSLGSIGSIKNRATSVHNLSVRLILFLHLCHYSHSGIDQGLIIHFYLSKVARSYSAVISMKRERYTSGGSFRRKI